jgi:hypothetical protein
MIVRFIQGSAFSSRLIILQEKTVMPFTPSHVEAVMPDGSYLGAHFNGGVQKRQPGYDKTEIANELFLTLKATPEQDNIFYAFMQSKIGEPYDWRAIFGFIIPAHLHKVDTSICSALTGLALRKASWFKWPVAVPWHLASPRDLLLMISARMQIPGI